MQTLIKALQNEANAEIAEHSKHYFKTGVGEYGEGDIFLGIRMPNLRKLAKQYLHLPPEDVQKVLNSPLHEQRLCALLIWVYQYPQASVADQIIIYEAYLDNTQCINNWDLVDVSAHHIVGAYLFKKNRQPLFKLSVSANLWGRRIAMMSCYYFIKRQDYDDALVLAKRLLNDKHDLIHKVVGWMLREIGKKDLNVETQFLNKHYSKMPRTLLRYAIEKFPEQQRQAYLKGTV